MRLRSELNVLFEGCKPGAKIWQLVCPFTAEVHTFDFSNKELQTRMYTERNQNTTDICIVGFTQGEGLYFEVYELRLKRRKWNLIQTGRCKTVETNDGKSFHYQIDAANVLDFQTETYFCASFTQNTLSIPDFYANYLESGNLKAMKPADKTLINNFLKDFTNIQNFFKNL